MFESGNSFKSSEITIFDFSKEDGKQTLLDIETILNDKFPVKLKTGKHYGALN